MSETEKLLDRVLYVLNNGLRVHPDTYLHEDIKAHMEKIKKGKQDEQ